MRVDVPAPYAGDGRQNIEAVPPRLVVLTIATRCSCCSLETCLHILALVIESRHERGVWLHNLCSRFEKGSTVVSSAMLVRKISSNAKRTCAFCEAHGSRPPHHDKCLKHVLDDCGRSFLVQDSQSPVNIPMVEARLHLIGLLLFR